MSVRNKTMASAMAALTLVTAAGTAHATDRYYVPGTYSSKIALACDSKEAIVYLPSDNPRYDYRVVVFPRSYFEQGRRGSGFDPRAAGEYDSRTSQTYARQGRNDQNWERAARSGLAPYATYASGDTPLMQNGMLSPLGPYDEALARQLIDTEDRQDGNRIRTMSPRECFFDNQRQWNGTYQYPRNNPAQGQQGQGNNNRPNPPRDGQSGWQRPGWQ